MFRHRDRAYLIAAVDWTSVTIGGAFVVGAVLATIATLRVLRIAANYLNNIETKKGRSDDH